MEQYKVLIHQQTVQNAMAYQKALQTKNATPGLYLADLLKEKDVSLLKTAEFIELLVRTKRPQIFAESAVYGDGRDWSKTEMSILGDISIAVPVKVFDNGIHVSPKVHDEPFCATLLYVPGALLANGLGVTPADLEEVTVRGKINPDGYYQLYERRLLPAFLYADSIARVNDRKALITIPGIGCGQFAGNFQGSLGFEFQKTLIRFLKNHCDDFPNIRVVYYDPYKECNNERIEIGQISMFVRPFTKGNTGKPQLCQPRDYQDSADDFSDCELFSVVAWDHVSWPGNDFYAGSRCTDDGVKAAATNSMAVMTEVEGAYDSLENKYNPPGKYNNWGAVILAQQIQLQVEHNLVVYPAIK